MWYGVEWDLIGQTQYNDTWKPSYSVATTACPYYINPGEYEFDPEKAKALLAEAGYGPSNPLKLETTMMETDRAALEAIQFYLQELGVQFTINIADSATAIAIWRSPGGSDLALWRAHRGSPKHEIRAGMTYAAHRLVDTFSYIDNERFQELYYILGHTLDENVLRDANIEIQQLIYDEVLAIPISECMYTLGFRTDKFQSQEQIKKIATTGSILQLSRLGLLSAWE
jgi:peptide/nickel transport system substrate-binding protein